MEVGRNDDDLWIVLGKIWIPKKSVELQMKLLVISHFGTSGHRAEDYST